MATEKGLLKLMEIDSQIHSLRETENGLLSEIRSEILKHWQTGTESPRLTSLETDLASCLAKLRKMEREREKLIDSQTGLPRD